MGLFGKKDACPVCGGEVKGLFNKKISGKQTLCKECSSKVSMTKELQKAATPEYIQEHLAYREKNLMKYQALRWDVNYSARELSVGVDPMAGFLYICTPDMDDRDNPVVFSFDQLTHYELYRLNKKVDDSETPGETVLETGLSFLSGVSKLIDSSNDSRDYFKIVLTTTDPYWPEIEEKINFDTNRLYGFGGFAEDLKAICQIFKQVIRKENTMTF